jgi:hypothetical protein
MPDFPNNAAKALERIFLKTRDSGANTVRDVWKSVLDTDIDSHDFVSRHSRGLIPDRFRRTLRI